MGRGLSLLEKQLGCARASGDRISEANALHDLGLMQSMSGLPNGETYLLSALDICQQEHDAPNTAFTRLNLGYHYLHQKDMVQAQAHLRRAQDMAGALGMAYVLTMALAFQANLIEDSDPARAEELLREALRRQRQYGDRPMLEAAEPLARLLMRLGRPHEARQIAADFLAEAQERGLRALAVPMLRVLSEIHEQLGDLPGALASLKQHVDEFVALRQTEYEQRSNALEIVNGIDALRQQTEAERQRAEELRRLSLTDELTGLPNRRALMQFSRETLLSGQTTLCILDLDRFKLVNDELGHEGGDQLLRSFARWFRRRVAQPHFVARFGGEEFIVLFLGLDLSAAAEEVRAILHELQAAPLTLDDGRRVSTNFTAGLSECRDGDFQAALRRADGGLYRGKAEGRSRVVPVGV